MSKHFGLIAALVCAAAATTHAAEVRITDHDQRFRTKYGIWPPHVQRALDAERREASERGRRDESERALRQQRSTTDQARDADRNERSRDNQERPCNCERKAN